MSDEAKSSSVRPEAEFADLLITFCMRDAFYVPGNTPGLYCKRDMGSFDCLQCICVDQAFLENGEAAFDSFLSAFDGKGPGPGTLFTFFFIFKNYKEHSDFAELLRRKQESCQARGLLTDFVAVDLTTASYFTLNGSKLLDKKLHAAIAGALAQYCENPADMSAARDRAAATVREAHKAVRSSDRLSVFSPVTVLIAINVAVFLVGIITEFLSGRNLPQEFGILDKTLVAQGEYWRLFTAMFLHGDLAHLFGNMYFLYILGRNFTKQYSTGRFLALYFLSGLAGSLLSCALSSYRSLGASGAIMGLGGALI